MARRSYEMSRRSAYEAAPMRAYENPLGTDALTIGLGVAGGVLVAQGVTWLFNKLTAPSTSG